jgi:uncharacterized protein (DUF488 family)
MRLFTIGFTKKSAEKFFESLKMNGVKRLIDIRLNNKSQLAGFAKADDLKYFLKISGIDYIYMPELAPTKELLDGYKDKKVDWEEYEKQYLQIINARDIKFDVSLFDGGCLLCSEDKPDKCHRRLAAEYLEKKIKGVNIVHI